MLSSSHKKPDNSRIRAKVCGMCFFTVYKSGFCLLRRAISPSVRHIPSFGQKHRKIVLPSYRGKSTFGKHQTGRAVCLYRRLFYSPILVVKVRNGRPMKPPNVGGSDFFRLGGEKYIQQVYKIIFCVALYLSADCDFTNLFAVA